MHTPTRHFKRTKNVKQHEQFFGREEEEEAHLVSHKH